MCLEITITSPNAAMKGVMMTKGVSADLAWGGHVYTFYSNGDGDNGDEGCFRS